MLTSDPSFDKHVTAVSDNCFLQLLQLRRIRRSLDSAANLAGSTTVQAVSWSVLRRRRPTSCSVFSMLPPVSSPTPASTIEGWVSTGEASFTGWTSTTGFGSVSVSRCKLTSVYTTWRLDTCRHSANRRLSVPGRRDLRSADRGEPDYLRICLSSYGGPAFAHAGLTNWNSLRIR